VLHRHNVRTLVSKKERDATERCTAIRYLRDFGPTSMSHDRRKSLINLVQISWSSQQVSLHLPK
jgi:hypothetical protein